MSHHFLPADRERAVSSAVARLAAGRSVLVFGSSGIGKTHVGATIAVRLAAADLHVARMRPTVDGRGILLGAVTARQLDDYLLQPLVPATRREAEEFLTSRSPLVMHVDDAHLFDDEHAAWLAALVDRGDVAYVIALNTETGAELASTSVLSRLWVEERASRIDLSVLDRHETEKLIHSLVGSIPIDTATRLGIYRGTGGLPLLVKELVHETMESGLVTGVTSTFIYPLPPMPSKRIIDIVWHRMRMLSDDERNALVILARLDGIPYERATRYLGDEIVRRLLLTGFAVREETTGTIRQAHRIEAETVLAVSGGAQLARVSIDVARRMRRDIHAGVKLTPLEYVLLAETMLGDDTEPRLAEDDDPAEVAAIFLAAAGKCLQIGTIYSGLSFARASSAAMPSVAAIIEESRCLCSMGNQAAAREALHAAVGLPRSPVEHSLFERWSIRLDSWTDPVTPLGDLVGDDPEGFLTLRHAVRKVMDIDWTDAAAFARTVAENRDAGPMTRLHALSVLLVSLARAGDGAGLERGIALGDELSTELRYENAWEQTVIESERDAFAAHRIVAQLMAGVGLAGIALELDERIDAALVRHDFTRLAILGSLVGFLDLCRGDTDAAETELRLAADRLIVVPDARWTVWIPGLRAQALIGAGRADEAKELLTRLESKHPLDSPLRRYASAFIRVEMRSDARRPSERDESPIALAQRLIGRAPSGELAAMLFAIDGRGDATAFVRRATDIKAATDLVLLQGIADFVIGVARHDAVLLEEAARELGSTGYFAVASSAASAAARVHSAAGRRVASAAAEALTRDFRSKREVRAGSVASDSIDLSGLTVREREIVTLVADGRTNREVADALFLSVRTVESHFYQARVKLGAMSRQELTRLVRLAQDGPEG